jgi:hypothetical protein
MPLLDKKLERPAEGTSGACRCQMACLNQNSLLAFATLRCNHESRTDYHQQWRKPRHTQISHSMKIKDSRNDCANEKKKSDQAESMWIQCLTSGRELTRVIHF